MKISAADRPYFLFLFPLFFVFHGFVQNARFIHPVDAVFLATAYMPGALILFLFFYAFLRNSINAALAACFVMTFYFFFGFVHDWLRKQDIFLHRYSILLPVFGVMTLLLTLWLRKKTSFVRLNLYLNLLFVLSILYDGATLAWRRLENRSPLLSAPAGGGIRPVCEACAKPDIYLLLFDEYTGSQTLRDVYHYDNHGLDSFLENEGFHIQRTSRSNYFITPFSMASMLDLSYLKGIAHPLALTPDDYTNLWALFRNCKAVDFLEANGYDIVNNSPFDLPGHPATLIHPLIVANTRLITYHTLADYLMRDMGFHLAHLVPAASLIDGSYELNETAIRRTVQASGLHAAHPRFIYMHVALPHFPYLFDSAGRRRSVTEAAAPLRLKDYLCYLPYTNARARQLITTILNNTGGKAVILFMSDHGLRDWADAPNPAYFFNNQNAVYYPDRDYTCLYDSISNVNQLRVVFNKLFRSNLPLLPDSTIFLQDSK